MSAMVKLKIQIMAESEDVPSDGVTLSLAALYHCQLLHECSVLSAVRNAHASCFVFPGDVFSITNPPWGMSVCGPL